MSYAPVAGYKRCVVQNGMSTFAVKEHEKSVLHKQAMVCIMTSLYDVMSHLRRHIYDVIAGWQNILARTL